MNHAPTRTVMEMLDELDERGLLADFAAIAYKHGAKLQEVLGEPRGTVNITNARQECYQYLRDREPHWSYPAIGNLFGRDHTSVMYGVRAHEKRLARAVLRAVRGAA